MVMTKPPQAELTDYFAKYINYVKEDNLINALIDQHHDFITFLKLIPNNKELYRYEENKWTIKDTLLHIIDTERVFVYRALCFARKHKLEQPGFEQDDFVDAAVANDRAMNDLIQEFDIIRQATISLFRSFNEEQLNASGIASGRSATPLILGFATVGHCAHHEKIIRERYL